MPPLELLTASERRRCSLIPGPDAESCRCLPHLMLNARAVTERPDWFVPESDPDSDPGTETCTG